MSRRGVMGMGVLILFSLCTMAAAVAITRHPPVAPLAVGERIVPFTAEPLFDVPPAEHLRRKAIVVFRPSCPHCMRMLDALRRARFEYAACLSGQTGVEWMFISAAELRETQAVLAGLDALPIYVDTSGSAVQALRVSHVPAWIVIDANGIVEHQEIGVADEAPFRSALNHICAEGQPIWTRQ